MDLYSQKSKSIFQKTVIIFLEIFIIGISYWILFEGGFQIIFPHNHYSGNTGRHIVLFIFNCIVFFLEFALLYLFSLKGKFPG